MKRKAVVLLDTLPRKTDVHEVREFLRFCADWLKRQQKPGMEVQVKIIGSTVNGDLRRVLSGFDVEIIKLDGGEDRLIESVNDLKPEVVFIGKSKIAKKIKGKLIGYIVEYTDSSKKELRIALAYGAGAFVLYTLIFESFNYIRNVLSHKGIASVALVLGTVVAVSYLYGNTISHLLKFLGIKPAHH